LASLADLIVDDVYRTGYVIFEEGQEVEATFYVVRQGRVHIKSADGSMDKEVGKGGYFGEDMLGADGRRGASRDPTDRPAYTVTVLEDCTLGCLTLEECRTVMDTTVIGKGKRKLAMSLVVNSEIKLTDLERHKILGAGTFGQVWLVSRVNRDGIKRPYALKVQSKYELVQNSQARGVVQEKNIMAQLSHPFIIQLVNTYQDKQRVYMLLGLVQGGELYSVLHNSKSDGVPEKSAKFYGSGILEGLSYMHRRHILYRDLKPENVLIDAQGYPVIVDLGFAKHVPEKTYTLCGTPLYIAPEVVLNRGHDKGADHWSLGVLIFEMIAGYTPFYKEGMDQITLFRAIVRGSFAFPKSGVMSTEAEDLILRLLVVDPSQRLGSLARGQKDIYRQSWFSNMNFDRLKRKEIRAPWVPKIKDPLDTANFENWDHLADKNKANDPPISARENALFDVF
jgi:serine/threonine protein kinase